MTFVAANCPYCEGYSGDVDNTDLDPDHTYLMMNATQTGQVAAGRTFKLAGTVTLFGKTKDFLIAVTPDPYFGAATQFLKLDPTPTPPASQVYPKFAAAQMEENSEAYQSLYTYNAATMDGTGKRMKLTFNIAVNGGSLATTFPNSTITNVVWAADLKSVEFTFMHTGGLPDQPGRLSIMGKSDPADPESQTFFTAKDPIYWWEKPTWQTAPSKSTEAGPQAVAINMNYKIMEIAAYTVVMYDGATPAVEQPTWAGVTNLTTSEQTAGARTYSRLSFTFTPSTNAAGKAWMLLLNFRDVNGFPRGVQFPQPAFDVLAVLPYISPDYNATFVASQHARHVTYSPAKDWFCVQSVASESNFRYKVNLYKAADYTNAAVLPLATVDKGNVSRAARSRGTATRGRCATTTRRARHTRGRCTGSRARRGGSRCTRGALRWRARCSRWA
jgi:hypothetical protein